MKRIVRNSIAVALLALMGSGVALAMLPAGWSFECEGSLGVYSGPNGSWMEVPNHRSCT